MKRKAVQNGEFSLFHGILSWIDFTMYDITSNNSSSEENLHISKKTFLQHVLSPHFTKFKCKSHVTMKKMSECKVDKIWKHFTPTVDMSHFFTKWHSNNQNLAAALNWPDGA